MTSAHPESRGRPDIKRNDPIAGNTSSSAARCGRFLHTRRTYSAKDTPSWRCHIRPGKPDGILPRAVVAHSLKTTAQPKPLRPRRKTFPLASPASSPPRCRHSPLLQSRLQSLGVRHELLDDLRRRLDEVGDAADGKPVQSLQFHCKLGHLHHDRDAVDHRCAIDGVSADGCE
jgi:hypothetical protein